MASKSQWKVTAAESGSKLLSFLHRHLGEAISLRAVKRSIESNGCRINGQIERFASSVVGQGDLIDFYLLDPPKAVAKGQSPAILYNDSYLQIINKPAGISCEKLLPLELVHRLDRETSGALIFAHSKQVKLAMIELFRQHKVHKSYLAIVDGVPTQPKGHIKGYLGKLCSYEGQTLWGETTRENGLWSETLWEVVAKGKDAALLSCTPLTGRTHQIRVHLSGIGHPILGDKQYGKSFRCHCHAPRCMLHALGLEFPHPINDEVVKVEAPLPIDFITAKEQLKL